MGRGTCAGGRARGGAHACAPSLNMPRPGMLHPAHQLNSRRRLPCFLSFSTLGSEMGGEVQRKHRRGRVRMRQGRRAGREASRRPRRPVELKFWLQSDWSGGWGAAGPGGPRAALAACPIKVPTRSCPMGGPASRKHAACRACALRRRSVRLRRRAQTTAALPRGRHIDRLNAHSCLVSYLSFTAARRPSFGRSFTEIPLQAHDLPLPSDIVAACVQLPLVDQKTHKRANE